MRLNLKITLIFGLIITCILSIIYFHFSDKFIDFTYKNIENNLLKQTYLARSYLHSNLKTDSTIEQLDEIADIIGKDLGVRATIIATDGKVLGDSALTLEEVKNIENHLYRAEVQKALKKGVGISRRFSNTVKKDLLYIALAIDKTNPKGFIRLSMPLSALAIISENINKMIFLLLAAAFILAWIISFIASSFISKPIDEMSKIARLMATGDFNQRIEINTNDEIRDLADSFNFMAQQVRSRIDEVITSKAHLEAVFLSMFEGVMLVDKIGKIILVNDSLKNNFSLSDDVVGKKTLEVVRNLEIKELVDQTLSQEEKIISKEISIVFPQEKIFLIHATAIFHKNEIDGAVLVFHDITELRRLEKIRQDFVANVSHELRTPIASIKGFAETLLQGALKDKNNAEDFVNIIYSDANRLATLINDILELSKIESGKMQLEKVGIDFKPIVDRIIKSLRKQAKDKALFIENKISKDLPQVLVDENKISQVVLNLLDNAIKYTQSSGKIEITNELDGRFMKIKISDTGIGIPQEDLSRVFERFYRVDKARSRELGGTGLGLSIVKHIVQAHGGCVCLESELGKGSTFIFTIPLA